MPLESTMICLDNSDWMRNGDYAPSRLESQHDAAGMLINDRINSNPENTVGVLTMAGNGVDLRVSPTEEAGKILACFGGIDIGGKADLTTAVQIAQLALKHRKNKNGGQRIIVFVGGPIIETVEKLQKIGKQLKKNNVAVDIVSMGEIDENSEKLLEFINATNSNDNSHLITVPPGVSPATAISSSVIMHLGGMMGGDSMGGGGGGAGSGAGGDNFDMYGGIDPSMDPELAMAIRASTEEARAQEEARMKAQQEASSSTATEAGAAVPSSSSGSGSFGGAGAADEEDEDALMQRALEMSMQEMLNVNDASAKAAAVSGSAAGQESKTAGNEEDDEEAELARALQMSVAPPAAPTAPSAFSDPSFASSLLSGADMNDPLIQAALAQMQGNQPPPPPGTNKDGDEKDDANKKRKGDDV